jgi:hypothetical protein
MKYGKIVDGCFTYAPNPINHDRKRVYNPTEAALSELGYKPIVQSECPQDGRHYKHEWVETTTEITSVWVDNEAEYWQSIPYDEAVDAEIRKRYSISQEFAVLRQEKEKPEEYAAYFAYCEACKAYVKQKKEEASNG